MDPAVRDKVLAGIRDYGWHFHRVGGGPTPVWTYTIGLQQTYRCPELVMAGAGSFSRRDIQRVFREVVGALAENPPAAGDVRDVSDAGPVRFQTVHPSWVRELLIEAVDFAEAEGAEPVEALQILPVGDRRTVDTPDLAVEVGTRAERPWCWLHDEWPYEIPAATLVLTDVDALHGAPVVRVWRNEDDAKGSTWEMSTSDVHSIPTATGRVVPAGTLLALDPSLADVLRLAPGKMTERRNGSAPWESKANAGRGAPRTGGAARRSPSRGGPPTRRSSGPGRAQRGR